MNNESEVVDEEGQKDLELQKQEEARKAESEARIAQESENLKKSEEARIRAEAQLDLMNKAMAESRATQSGQATWGNAEWENFTAQTGIPKEHVSIHASIANEAIKASEKKIEERLRLAEQKASQAEERATRFEKRSTYEKTKQDYYAKKPELARYDKDVNEFLSKFPESEREDPTKLNELMAMSETYVRGKVGDKMKQTSPKLGNNSDDTEMDTSELDEEDRRAFSKLIPDTSKLKGVESLTNKNRRGILIKSEEEWALAEKDFRRK